MRSSEKLLADKYEWDKWNVTDLFGHELRRPGLLHIQTESEQQMNRRQKERHDEQFMTHTAIVEPTSYGVSKTITHTCVPGNSRAILIQYQRCLSI